MSDLIAIAYDDEFKAEEVRLTLAKLQKEYLIELEDAAIVNLTAAGAVSGGFWGFTDWNSIFCT